jgi:hypothetical protein
MNPSRRNRPAAPENRWYRPRNTQGQKARWAKLFSLWDAILQRDQRVIHYDGLIRRGEVITWDHVRLYESNTVVNLPRQQDAL